MFSKHINKSIAVLAMIGGILAGCGRDRDSAGSAERPVFVPTLGRIPFSTREPDVFEAEIIVTSGEIVRRTFVAKSGERRRVEFDFGKRSSLARILNGKTILVLPGRSRFSEIPPESPFSTDDWSAFLTDRWLSETTDAAFEKLETSGNTTKYRARLGVSGNSEAIITVDGASGIPIRQEFFSVSNGVSTLTMVFEIRNLKFSANDALFVLPDGFEKAEIGDLLKMKRELETANSEDE